MNIVIVGGGEIGLYLASVLSQAENNVTIIDFNAERLKQASSTMDVGVREGNGTDWQLLEDLMELEPDVFLAMTKSDETNLACCAVAKSLGYPKTVARVRNPQYLRSTRLDFGRLFHADHFIGPDYLGAHEIFKHILSANALEIQNFSHGAIQMQTLIAPPKFNSKEEPLSRLGLPEGIMVGLLWRPPSQKGRPGTLIFPHGSDVIYPGDEVTIIGQGDAMQKLPSSFKSTPREIKSATIVGGSLVGQHLASLLLQQGIHVQIIDQSYKVCQKLSDKLPRCTIIHHDGTDPEFLRAEKMGMTEVLIACTRSDETNLTIAALFKQLGCDYSIVVLEDPRFSTLAEELGVDHAVSPFLTAANTVLTLTSAQKVSSMISLYDNQAEIIEIKVDLDSKITGIPLNVLGPKLPQDFLIAVIQNRGRVMVANGNRILSPGDSVVVISSPKHFNELKQIF